MSARKPHGLTRDNQRFRDEAIRWLGARGNAVRALTALVVFPAGDLWSRNWLVGAGAAVLVTAGVFIAVVAGSRFGNISHPSPHSQGQRVSCPGRNLSIRSSPYLHRGAGRRSGHGVVGRLPRSRGCVAGSVGCSGRQSSLRRGNVAREICRLPRLSRKIRAFHSPVEQYFPPAITPCQRVPHRLSSEA